MATLELSGHSRADLRNLTINQLANLTAPIFFSLRLALWKGHPEPFIHFLVVRTANGVSLDFIDAGDFNFTPQHYAFLVSDRDFDQIFARIKSRNLTYWADPAAQQPAEINTHFGGRGLYFRDPSGHYMEIITRPYGSV